MIPSNEVLARLPQHQQDAIKARAEELIREERSRLMNNNLNWLDVFSVKGIKQFLSELITSIENNQSPESIIHEWHESAIALQSNDLADAFNDESDEVLLTKPNDLCD